MSEAGRRLREILAAPGITVLPQLRSGTGLVAGVVFGRLAGEGAARAAARNHGR
jgi:hypothetical protein